MHLRTTRAAADVQPRRHRPRARSRLAGELIGPTGGQPGPLRGWPTVGAKLVADAGVDRLRPAVRRILPKFLPPIHGEIEQVVAGGTGLNAATVVPVRL